ncbi:unnamed protein product [Lactuca virosa]|uniref:Gnk2-homologous domain-containing protein n=1 Tax=Lactuca virosa TaxID=75947 RepID=A0AAU9NTL9_9ASTR|nr:unnamed protein product [Lactuca virosa]
MALVSPSGGYSFTNSALSVHSREQNQYRGEKCVLHFLDGAPVYGLAWCRGYVSIPDCLNCFNNGVAQLNRCGVANGAHGFYNKCDAWDLHESSTYLNLIDEKLDPSEYAVEHAMEIIKIALMCTQPPSTRPAMSEVVMLLSEKSLQEILLYKQPVYHSQVLLKNIEICRLYDLDSVSENVMKIDVMHH